MMHNICKPRFVFVCCFFVFKNCYDKKKYYGEKQGGKLREEESNLISKYKTCCGILFAHTTPLVSNYG